MTTIGLVAVMFLNFSSEARSRREVDRREMRADPIRCKSGSAPDLAARPRLTDLRPWTGLLSSRLYVYLSKSP